MSRFTDGDVARINYVLTEANDFINDAIAALDDARIEINEAIHSAPNGSQLSERLRYLSRRVIEAREEGYAMYRELSKIDVEADAKAAEEW
ncbi:hypothetical protein [Schaalia sp. ZJ1691]|uniref:hypothetical protein n=1 Tax=Schaalia sp. ZJ1691 TaxID=2709404 RepID=UPI0013E9E9A5|nr:hypothetical protein [Schaalia sp. ZJ1691]